MSALPHVAWVDRALEPELRALVDGRAKPPGSLGRIEALAIQLGLIAGHTRPRADRTLLLVFAGDHGFAAAGASSYPPQVTETMVRLLLAGGATANAFARAVGAQVRVVDAGVAADLAPNPLLIEAKVRKGTRDASREPALTAAEVDEALVSGARIAGEAAADGYDLLAIGEMGIGNSAAAALLLHRLCPAPLADCIGAGAGQDAAGLSRKAALLRLAAARAPASADPREALAQFGGCEITMMAGAILGAAASRRPVLVDGFIAGAAALAAIRLEPAARDYCVFAHRSAERGHAVMLERLEAEPLLDLSMRLGEGTGALLAAPLVRAAAGLLSEVASLEDVLAGWI